MPERIVEATYTYLRPYILQKCVEEVKDTARCVGSSAKCPLCREPTQHAVRSAVLDELAEIIRRS